ncbi:MAG: hypothetical protein K0Q89_116 [Thermomicrobiales bacterium]|jgi:hypothetical protein|nr:hypothetical protein [Thermomicrobiales bacterium]
MQIDRDSTEYLFIGVTGDVPSVGAEVAFVAPAARPLEADWDDAILVTSSGHALWDDALASGVSGDYYLARLVGPFSSNDVVLTAGDYQCWVRLTDTVERPIRVAPAAVEVE